MGRPSSYRPEYPKLARVLSLEGHTDAMIAQALRVGAATLSDWKLRHPQFALALRQGRGLPEPTAAPEYPKAETLSNANRERDLRPESDGDPKPENLTEPHMASTRGVAQLERVWDTDRLLERKRRPTTALM